VCESGLRRTALSLASAMTVFAMTGKRENEEY
jgi:hypothetical protein